MAPAIGISQNKKNLSASRGLRPTDRLTTASAPGPRWGPGPKRGFSCSQSSRTTIRLATGRVQTAEWTNGHAVCYVGPFKPNKKAMLSQGNRAMPL